MKPLSLRHGNRVFALPVSSCVISRAFSLSVFLFLSFSDLGGRMWLGWGLWLPPRSPAPDATATRPHWALGLRRPVRPVPDFISNAHVSAYTV